MQCWVEEDLRVLPDLNCRSTLRIYNPTGWLLTSSSCSCQSWHHHREETLLLCKILWLYLARVQKYVDPLSESDLCKGYFCEHENP